MVAVHAPGSPIAVASAATEQKLTMRQAHSVGETLDSLRNVILWRAKSESDPGVAEALGTGKDRPDYGEKGLSFRPVHVQGTVAQVNGDLLPIELPHPSSVDRGL